MEVQKVCSYKVSCMSILEGHTGVRSERYIGRPNYVQLNRPRKVSIRSLLVVMNRHSLDVRIRQSVLTMLTG